MSEITAFSSDKEPLEDLLKSISTGKTQLPEFQRGWVWDDLHIRSLLASVSLSYPIGALMMLETGNPDVRFKARPVEGVELQITTTPERYILDGQQRLTSLFQSVFINKPVKTRDSRGKAQDRFYYIKIMDALDQTKDRTDAIVSLPTDRKVRKLKEVKEDYSSPDKEYQSLIFPLNKVFDSADWRMGFGEYWKQKREKNDPPFEFEKMNDLWNEFEKKILKAFIKYQVPIILLKKQTPKVAVCNVFEKVNTGGVPLTVFELMTATYAADEYDLREDWEGKRNEIGKKVGEGREHRIKKHNVLKGVTPPDFLSAISLVSTWEKKKEKPEVAISCKRADILSLDLPTYKELSDKVEQGFERTARFLNREYIFFPSQLPYSTQLIPLAAIYVALGKEAESDLVHQKLSFWFWSGIFGELYGGAVETRFARDLPEVLAWIKGGEKPSSIQECNFSTGRLLTLKTRNSAAYKGLGVLLIREGGRDFKTGEPFVLQKGNDDKIDIHHIFPQAYCKKNGIDPGKCDSIINKTPISATTNKIIGGLAPSKYLLDLEAKTSRLEEILKSHLINVQALREDNFNQFFESRKESLLNIIEKATGKSIERGSLQPEEDDADDFFEESENYENENLFYTND